MVNSHFKTFLLGKQSFYKVFSNGSYGRLKFHILAWLGLNPDYAPANLTCTLQSLTGNYRGLEGHPSNEIRDPAMRTGVPCNIVVLT